MIGGHEALHCRRPEEEILVSVVAAEVLESAEELKRTNNHSPTVNPYPGLSVSPLNWFHDVVIDTFTLSSQPRIFGRHAAFSK